MNYVKANEVLPQELIEEIQKYVQGKTLYIPKTKEAYEKWGARTGTKAYINERNHSIKSDFKAGISIGELMEMYYLSEESIKKIVYTK
ncbi:CD3324 family protein [Halobacillus massiliensis]|uniref:CD3324 family protein n=1 Tax=Halobacillus massiliensis TaxID=1926286 RepID=UPI0009E4CAE0|nr:CD3324 family protein [Halobacillus massiliensis]